MATIVGRNMFITVYNTINLHICICTGWSCFFQSIIVFVYLKTGTFTFIILAYRIWYGHLNPKLLRYHMWYAAAI